MSVRQKIIELYKQGHSKDYIARQVGLLPSHIDEVIDEIETDTVRASFDDFKDFADALQDTEAFIKGLVSVVGLRALEMLKNGEVEEIVNGSVRSEPRVLKRKLDAKDLKQLMDTIDRAKNVLDGEVGSVAEQLRTLRIEFVDKCEADESS